MGGLSFRTESDTFSTRKKVENQNNVLLNNHAHKTNEQAHKSTMTSKKQNGKELHMYIDTYMQTFGTVCM